MSRLLVPICLEVLVIRPGDASGAWADTRWRPAQRPASGEKPARQDLFPLPFTNLANDRPKGAYLHWAMPDALSIHRAGASSFPALPCRWLIVRLDGLAGNGENRRVTTWLIPNIHAETPEFIPNGHVSTHPIGPSTTTVTVRGRGHDGPHPAWALNFDDTLGRLAFYDPLDDASIVGPIAYGVYGWYTHPALDPLAPRAKTTATPSSFSQKLQDLRWDAELSAGAAPPTASLYHGCALAIGWPTLRWPGDNNGALSQSVGGVPGVDELRIALADTLAAATAALLDGQSAPDAATLAEAVLTGHVAELSHADGSSRLDEIRHQSRFHAIAPRESTSDVIYQEDAATPAIAPVAQPMSVATDGSAGSGNVVHLHKAAAAKTKTTAADDATAIGLIPVSYPTPRTWSPDDPVLAVSGLGRTLRHGADGRYHELGFLHCRFTGQTLTGATPAPLPAWTPAKDVPPEVGDLLIELALLDPGSATDLGGLARTSAMASARATWWNSWSADWTQIPANTGWQGTLPSPVGVTRPLQPWNPLRLEWEFVYTPTPLAPSYWNLGETDYSAADPLPASTLTPLTLAGTGWLSAAPAHLLASAAGADTDEGKTFSQSDVVAASLEGFYDRLRGVPRGIWVSSQGIDDTPSAATLAHETYAARSLVAGTWKLGRVRAVDTFGQFLTIYDPAGTGAVAALPHIPKELLPGNDGALLLRPRFTATASLQARFLGPTGDQEISAGQNPLCGFLLPSPLDATLEFSDPEGNVVCRIRPDSVTNAGVLEEAPGGADASPYAGAKPLPELGAGGKHLPPTLAKVAAAVLAADRRRTGLRRREDSALAALLRLIDLTRSTVDVIGRAGDDQLSLLLGLPVAVMRIGVSITVNDPQASDLAVTPVACRIGSLTNLQDGVLGWIVEDHPEIVHPVHQAVLDMSAEDDDPVDLSSSSLIGGPLLWLRPGETRTVILLVSPNADVSLVTGLVPSKRLQTEREWTERPLRRLTPVLAVDAALRDPQAISLPVPGGVHGNWTWWRKTDPATGWEGTPLSADPPSSQPTRPVEIEDGYLRVALIEDPPYHGIPLQVTAVRRWGPAQTIQALAGLQADGKTEWRLPIDSVVEMIESGRYWFFVRAMVNGVSKDITLVTDFRKNGSKYARTAWDESPVNNLDNLPTF